MWHDVEQNTDDWFALRSPVPTSSSLAKIMANFGKDFGDPAKKYAVDIAAAILSGTAKPAGYTNDHMERGHEEEPIARMMYESEYFCEVTNGGFYATEKLGGSPDGLVGEHGMIEIKSAIPSVHYDRLVRQSYDSAYKWQLLGNLKISKRQWIDFISFCSSFPVGKQLYVYRCYAKDFQQEFEMIDTRLDEFWKLIDESRENILNQRYSVIAA